MDNTWSILDTLTKLVTTNASNTEPLVSTLKQLLALQTPTSFYYFESWVHFSSEMASAVAEAGLAQWLLSIITLEDEEDKCYYNCCVVVTALSTLVNCTTDETQRRNLKQLFFDNEKAVEVAINMTTPMDYAYVASEVAGALGILVKDFPRGASHLRWDESILTAALRLFDNPEHDLNNPILLIAEICTPGEPRLTALLHLYLDVLDLIPDQAPKGPQGKKKKKKKKKHNHIHMSEHDTWKRITLLTCASPASRKCH
ncbi:hypothetical protein H0H81_004455 [Sphagnurus paluster]|uniref:Uncharacterized protein n=1 Tax=Sphagnurus paluster TaxID=117069 RepID=A0A9P7GHG8_9AGAR|nr:hypothetical protein H0H81_004455 [Sphagnurus paluster]